VSPGHQQRHRRLGQRPVLQLVHRDVGDQVVDPVQRDSERRGQGPSPPETPTINAPATPARR
jgi:hypothetical protein